MGTACSCDDGNNRSHTNTPVMTPTFKLEWRQRMNDRRKSQVAAAEVTGVARLPGIVGDTTGMPTGVARLPGIVGDTTGMPLSTNEGEQLVLLQVVGTVLLVSDAARDADPSALTPSNRDVAPLATQCAATEGLNLGLPQQQQAEPITVNVVVEGGNGHQHVTTILAEAPLSWTQPNSTSCLSSTSNPLSPQQFDGKAPSASQHCCKGPLCDAGSSEGHRWDGDDSAPLMYDALSLLSEEDGVKCFGGQGQQTSQLTLASGHVQPSQQGKWMAKHPHADLTMVPFSTRCVDNPQETDTATVTNSTSELGTAEISYQRWIASFR